MSDYMVRFNVHLIPLFKPEGWPNPVVHQAVFRADTFKSLQDQVDAHMWTFLKQKGVVILKDPKKHLSEDITTMDLRQFLPMHMIAFISQTTTPLMGDVPDLEDDDLFIQ